mmetsp:Transcript_24485/g.61394  ORF Transcript_24485/g.61394 Transcript_24485/m.61394 type:complete len:201 (-) Transcript_24485:224-826(-)|eukprot:CAMPEP_0177645428 /NCGR_PEP_ID=MMETSP0447-20121125/9241_1 /TAXON_ID=0 /ORGANISM="Stygamoeba regulata, Strain BSH-02190019" /LENGTH=200 /DNA_ID=CAMNT_0019147905 /DNA_START=134 /DNA_END=733 /DNA_ORIENTATION=+
MVFCTQCGTALPGVAKFCSKCGTPTVNASASSQSAPASSFGSKPKYGGASSWATAGAGASSPASSSPSYAKQSTPSYGSPSASRGASSGGGYKPKPKYGGASSWATTNHAPVSTVEAPQNKFAGGQKWEMRGHDGGYGGSASARRDGGGSGGGGARPEVVKSGLSKVTYGKQPSWAYAEQEKNRSGQYRVGENTQGKRLW